MKIAKKINAPVSFIYGKFIDSILYDVHQSTGKSLRLIDLKDYEYVKVFSKKSSARIKITELQENKVYTFQTETTIRRYTTSYLFRTIDANTCEIICEEQVVSHGFFNHLNDVIVGVALGWLKKKQKLQMLEAIGRSYSS